MFYIEPNYNIDFDTQAVENTMSIRTRFPVNPPTSYDCICGNGTIGIPEWKPYDYENCEVRNKMDYSCE